MQANLASLSAGEPRAISIALNKAYSDFSPSKAPGHITLATNDHKNKPSNFAKSVWQPLRFFPFKNSSSQNIGNTTPAVCQAQRWPRTTGAREVNDITELRLLMLRDARPDLPDGDAFRTAYLSPRHPSHPFPFDHMYNVKITQQAEARSPKLIEGSATTSRPGSDSSLGSSGPTCRTPREWAA